mmetsp:Transcript_25886/g.38053  ORF Transcript_25886/g.38053 Transcript_25886/m.38053 type:complete len:263 (-) Transcript_25886:66-854(-)
MFLFLKSKVLKDSLSIDLLLHTHTGGSQHSKTSVLKLLGNHNIKLLRVLRLQAKRIKSNVSGVVVVTKLPQGFGPVTKVWLDPSNSSTPEFCRGNRESKEGESRCGHLLQLIISRSMNIERSRNSLSSKVSNSCKHGHTSVHNLGLTVALHFIQCDSALCKSKWIEEASGSKSTGKSVAGKRFVRYPSVDRSDDGFRNNIGQWGGSSLGSNFGGFLFRSGADGRLHTDSVARRSKGSGRADEGGDDCELHCCCFWKKKVEDM